jgi:hypothetical protein
MDDGTLLHKVEVPRGDARRPTSVSVVRRKTDKTDRDGRQLEYINLVLTIGDHKLYVKRSAAPDIIKAMMECVTVAEGAYQDLLAEINPRR